MYSNLLLKKGRDMKSRSHEQQMGNILGIKYWKVSYRCQILISNFLIPRLMTLAGFFPYRNLLPLCPERSATQ